MISSVNIPHGVVGAPKARHIIIVKAYKDWIQSVPNKKVWNRSLNNYIHINALSITETANLASLSYWSTYAVLHLDYILRYAEKDGPTRTPKPNENQSKFSRIQIMKCYVAKNRLGKNDCRNTQKRRPQYPVLHHCPASKKNLTGSSYPCGIIGTLQEFIQLLESCQVPAAKIQFFFYIQTFLS